MAQSPGKKFEADFEKSVSVDWFIYRLKDCPNAWPGKEGTNPKNIRFTPKNMCDFLVYTGVMYYGVECKSFKGKSMSYGNIADHQLDGLLEMSITGPKTSQGMFLLNFRDLSETYAINAFLINALIESGERKSISIEEARANGVLIPQEIKRTRYKYDLTVLGG